MKKTIFALVVLAFLLVGPAVAILNASECTGPPFVATSAPPLVMLVMERDHKLYYEAYNDASDLDEDGMLDIGYKHSIDYYGYFDPRKCYTYDTTGTDKFVPSRKTETKYCGNANEWSGNFLNWLSMSRMDALRKVLYGGHRSTDSGSETVLEGVYIPQDAHSWGKEYAGADTRQLTPWDAPSSGRHLFCMTSTGEGDPHIIRVALNGGLYRIWEWASTERAVCSGPESGGYRRGPIGTRDNIQDFDVRVKVCDTTIGVEDNCRLYPGGGGAYKPMGLLQQYAEGDGSKACSKTWKACNTDADCSIATDGLCLNKASMYLGLLTGSYEKNLSGGVLRKNIYGVLDEVNTQSGSFQSSESEQGNIIITIDRMKVVGFNYSDFAYTDSSGGTCSWITSRVLEEGKCRMWGNPVGEMMYDTLRYFSGKSAGSSAYVYSGTQDSGLSLSKPAWGIKKSNTNYPVYDIYPSCAKGFMLVLSDVNTNFDSDQIPGAYSTFATDPPFTGDLTNLSVTNLANNIGSHEDIPDHSWFIGQRETLFDFVCSSKSVSSLSSIRGLCPEEPTKQGSFSPAAVAHYGKSHFTANTDKPDVTTLAVALSSTVPDINIKVGLNNVRIIPVGKSVSGCENVFNCCSSTSSRCGGETANSAKCVLTSDANGLHLTECPSKAYCPSNQIVDFYVDTITYDVDKNVTYAKFRVNFEDVEQGADHDMDAIVTYEISALPDNQVRVRLESGFAAGCIDQILGFAISGTTADGVYLVVKDGDIPDIADGDTPTVVASMPKIKEMDFSVIGGATRLLKPPLWYAAKWGGFTDSNGNGWPDIKSEWDKDNDDVPDNYFFVANPLKLYEQLERAFQAILGRVGSAGAVATVTQQVMGQDVVVRGAFTSYEGDPSTFVWKGHLESYWPFGGCSNYVTTQACTENAGCDWAGDICMPACSDFSAQANCTSHSGCQWTDGRCFASSTLWSTCSAQTTEATCAGNSSCKWKPYGPRCVNNCSSYTDQAHCTAAGAKCQWNATPSPGECVATSVDPTCGSISTESSCSADVACKWKAYSGTWCKSTCASATSSAACTEISGCQWINDACVAGGILQATCGEAQTQSDCTDKCLNNCSKFTDESHCTAVSQCQWSNDQCIAATSGSTCESFGTESACRAQTACAWREGCTWDETPHCTGLLYSFQKKENFSRFCFEHEDHCWEAEQRMPSPGGRTIFTLLNGSRKEFDSTNICTEADWLALSGDGEFSTTDCSDLIDWIRGEDGWVKGRSRDGWKLGDIVYSTPVVVQAPSLSAIPMAAAQEMCEASCAGGCEDCDSECARNCFYCYRDCVAHRKKVVYVGANDGMLHAFVAGVWWQDPDVVEDSDGDGETDESHWIYDPQEPDSMRDGNSYAGLSEIGEELWAYIPSNLLSKMKELARTTYGTQDGCPHRFMVDLSPQAWDVFIDPDGSGPETRQWRTVLIGGQRGGGDTYFALDITDPENPLILWEYSAFRNKVLITGSELSYQATLPYVQKDTYEQVKALPMSWSVPYLGRLEIPDGIGFLAADPVYSWTPSPVVVSPSTRYSSTLSGWVAVIGNAPRVYSLSDLPTSLTEEQKLATLKPDLLLIDVEKGVNLFQYSWPILVQSLATEWPSVQSASGTKRIPYSMGNPTVLDIWDSEGDLENDGYLDHIFVGDIDGLFYSLKFNMSSGTAKGVQVDVYRTRDIPEANRASNDFRPAGREPISVLPTVAFDEDFNLRVYFGTGKYDNIEGSTNDKTDTSTMTFYNLKESVEKPMITQDNIVTKVSTIPTFFTMASNPSTAGGFNIENFAFKVVSHCSTQTWNTECSWVKPKVPEDTLDPFTPDCCETSCATPCWDCMLTLRQSGERVIDSALVAGGLVFFTSFVPMTEPCAVGGYAYLYVMDYQCRSMRTDPFADSGFSYRGGESNVTQQGQYGHLSSGGADGSAGFVAMLGPGMPSRPVLDSSGQYVFIQTSDGRIHRVEIKLDMPPMTLKGWKEQ